MGWVFWIAVLALIVWTATSTSPYAQQVQEFANLAHAEEITPAVVSLGAHNFAAFKFTVPSGAGNVTVRGQFSSTGGSDGAVEAYLLSDAAFVSWQDGYSSSTYYESGRVAQSSIDVSLPMGPGSYYLVFNNKFSPRAPKTVQALISVRYNRWWPSFHL